MATPYALPARSVLILVLIAWTFLPLPCPAQTAPDNSKWEKDIAAFEASDKTNPPPRGALLFIGSSSIRLWKTLPADFPEHKVVNRGFGGSEIADSVRFAERIVFPYQPSAIVMYAGGNDINAGHSPAQVLADFKAFVAKVRAKLPDTPVAYISIAPNPARWAQVDRVREANRLIAEFAGADPKLRFIDTFPHMLGEDGKPKPDIFSEDRLHMNAKGYELWTSILRPHLAAMVSQK
jgi:lysophospholipase L1-like esterase